MHQNDISESRNKDKSTGLKEYLIMLQIYIFLEFYHLAQTLDSVRASGGSYQPSTASLQTTRRQVKHRGLRNMAATL